MTRLFLLVCAILLVDLRHPLAALTGRQGHEMGGQLTLGWRQTSKHDYGNGWTDESYAVVLRRSGYVVAEIGTLWRDKRRGSAVVWGAMSGGAFHGRYSTRTEAVDAIRSYARAQFCRALDEGVL